MPFGRQAVLARYRVNPNNPHTMATKTSVPAHSCQLSRLSSQRIAAMAMPGVTHHADPSGQGEDAGADDVVDDRQREAGDADDFFKAFFGCRGGHVR